MEQNRWHYIMQVIQILLIVRWSIDEKRIKTSTWNAREPNNIQVTSIKFIS